jgi:4-amino-4-deoxy-L-arabinose transferase-like glycosyltransferase
LHGDEALTGLDALRINSEGWIGPYVGSALGQPSGPLYFTALVFNLSDPSIFTLRFSMAILGTATIPAAYLLFRSGFGLWIAVFASIALTFSYWHIHFSRTAFMVISMPLMITLVSIALLWAFRTRQLLPWFLSGLLLGAGVYSYNGYPIFLGAVAMVLLVNLALKRNQWRQQAQRYALLGLAAVIAAFPLIQLAVTKPDFYFSHARNAFILQDDDFAESESIGDRLDFIGERIARSSALLIHFPHIDGVDASGGRGTLAPAIAVLAYLGLAISIFRWRSPPYLLAATVVISALIAPVLATEYGGDLRRSLIAVPFVYGLAGIAALEIVVLSKKFRGETGNRLAAGAVAASLITCAAWNTWYYFGYAVDRQQTEWTFGHDLVESLDTVKEINDPGVIYFFSKRWRYNYETRQFLYPKVEGIDRSREFGEFSLEKTHRGPVTYLLLPSYLEVIDPLKRMYPDGQLLVKRDSQGKVKILAYHLS